jgi:hypothetical protein
MSDAQMEALEALLEQISLEDDVAGVALCDGDGNLIAAAGEADTVDVMLVDSDPDELEHFEKDPLGATAIPLGGTHGQRCQFLIGGKMRLGLSFELDADLDEVKALGQQAGLEVMTLFKRLRNA